MTQGQDISCSLARKRGLEQDLPSKTLSNPIALLPYGKQNALLALHANKSQTQAEPPDSSWVLSTESSSQPQTFLLLRFAAVSIGGCVTGIKAVLKCPQGVQDSARVTSPSTFTGLVLHQITCLSSNLGEKGWKKPKVEVWLIFYTIALIIPRCSTPRNIPVEPVNVTQAP